jgi:hypothetical protein
MTRAVACPLGSYSLCVQTLLSDQNADIVAAYSQHQSTNLRIPSILAPLTRTMNYYRFQLLLMELLVVWPHQCYVAVDAVGHADDTSCYVPAAVYPHAMEYERNAQLRIAPSLHARSLLQRKML